MRDATKYPPVGRKLTLVTTLISGTALLLAGVTLGAYDQITLRAAMVGNRSIQAQMLASNSVTALTFNDPAAAEATLAALRAARHVIAATIHDADGRLFATYTRDRTNHVDASLNLPTGAEQVHAFDDERLVLARRIVFQSRNIGSVTIASDLDELTKRRDEYVVIVGAVWAVSLLAALVMSWLARRNISHPITQLAAVARQVSTEKDYSLRANVTGNAYEIVVLAHSFNEMLEQIQLRDRFLSRAQEELEERVRQRTAELDAANKELEAFSYSVSHDLRAPLRHVVGFAGLLQEHAKDAIDDQGRKYLHTITSAATKMGRLIDDLLSFSRMGRSQLARQRVSLNDVVRDARRDVMAHSGSGRTIEWQVANLPDVEGDAAMLRLVMDNLLSNAVKYSAPRPVARIEVGVNGGGSRETVVYVRDNGVGFDMQYAHKLFGVFQRLHRADEFEGTGVGLANVGRIIRRHGGRVWAESRPDEGATFYFAIPTKGREGNDRAEDDSAG
jgi:signal transduction histidine kinase